MDYVALTTETLRKIHADCTNAYHSDRSLSEREQWLAENCGSYFGVEEYSDWPTHVKNVEKELMRRNEQFDSIELQPPTTQC